MSGKKLMTAVLTAILSGTLMFSGCGKKTEKKEPEPESVAQELPDLSDEPIVATSTVDPNESYAAQVQAELGDVEIPTTDVTTRTDAVSVPALSQTMASPDGTIQIKVPGTWADLKGQIDASGALDGYIIQTGSPGEAQYLIYTNEAKSDAENAPITNIDEYSGWLVQYITSVTSPLQNAQVEGRSNVRLTQSTMDGIKTVLTGTYNSQEVVFFVYAVEGSGSYHQFCCWAPIGIRKSAEATFDAVVNSFAAF